MPYSQQNESSKEECGEVTERKDCGNIQKTPIKNKTEIKSCGDTPKTPVKSPTVRTDYGDLQTTPVKRSPDRKDCQAAQRTPIKSPLSDVIQQLICLTTPPPEATVKSQDRPISGTSKMMSPRTAHVSNERIAKEIKKIEHFIRTQECEHQVEMDKKNAEQQAIVEELERVQSRLAEYETKLKANLEQEHRLKKEVAERTKSKHQLSLVMEEYEKTISQMVALKEEEKKGFEIQKDVIIKERDTALQHLNNMEIAFNDVHQKYERSKAVIESMKTNEDSLKKSLEDNNNLIKSVNTKHESLKNHAVKQLEAANLELDHMRRIHQVELAKLNAKLKKAEVKAGSLEDSLEHKVKENQELTAICDELISKVGGGS